MFFSQINIFAMKNNKDKKRKSLSDKLIKNKAERFDNRFKLAPKGVLLMTLAKYYVPRSKDGMKNLEQFEQELMQQLSLLATDGKANDELGKDFNEFFKYVIGVINRCNMLEEAVHELGLEVTDENEEVEEE